MKTQAIERFLAEQYTDERLSALLAFAQDGKLGFYSCCCFIGIMTADHALRTSDECKAAAENGTSSLHLLDARKLSGAFDAELEFCNMGSCDHDRRANLIPLIQAEMDRREAQEDRRVA